MEENQLTYEQALEKLTSLQEQMENNEIGIDDLGSTMKEANELLRYCKQRLRKTQEQLEELSEADNA